MATKYYDLDPGGDVRLTIRSPKPYFAVWDEAQDYPSNLPDPSTLDLLEEIFVPKPRLTKKQKMQLKAKRVGRDSNEPEFPVPAPLEEAPLPSYDPPASFGDTPFDDAPLKESSKSRESCQDIAEPGNPLPYSSETLNHMRIRVSSRHLTLASPYFSRMLQGPWEEAYTVRTNGFVSVDEEDVDADALVILMNIVHGRTRSVPKKIDLDTLAKIAIIVDKFECAEAVEVFTDMWIAHLKDAIPRLYSRDTMLWICISWVFRQPDAFQLATSAALKQSNGPIQYLGLPIPSSVINEIDQRRQESIKKILTAMRDLARDLIKSSYGCSFECRCMLLGALITAMDARKLTFSEPPSPYIGFSFVDTLESFRNVRSPERCPGRRNYDYDQLSLPYSLGFCIDPLIKSLETDVNGLLLPDYPQAS